MMRGSRIVLWAIAGTAIATICAPLIIIQFAGRWLRTEEIITSGVLVLVYLITMLACMVALENGRSPRLMRSGMIAGAIALAGWIAMLMIQPNWPGAFVWMRILIWPSSWGILMTAYAVLLMPNPHVRWWIILRAVSLGMLSMMAMHVCVAFLFYPTGDWEAQNEYEQLAVPMGAIIAIIAAGSVLTTFITAWIPRFTGAVQHDVQRRAYWLRCPRCKQEHDAITGTHACPACGLRVRVETS